MNCVVLDSDGENACKVWKRSGAILKKWSKGEHISLSLAPQHVLPAIFCQCMLKNSPKASWTKSFVVFCVQNWWSIRDNIHFAGFFSLDRTQQDIKNYSKTLNGWKIIILPEISSTCLYVESWVGQQSQCRHTIISTSLIKLLVEVGKRNAL